jgi:hypothetical protein
MNIVEQRMDLPCIESSNQVIELFDVLCSIKNNDGFVHWNDFFEDEKEVVRPIDGRNIILQFVDGDFFVEIQHCIRRLIVTNLKRSVEIDPAGSSELFLEDPSSIEAI